MNVILFGPPGIGKSTIIGKLKDAGVRAVDLEDVYPNKIRFQLPNMLTSVVIGAADLDPHHTYPGCYKVLLWLPQKEYESRRKHRDSLDPSKAYQAEHVVDDWLRGVHYDSVLEAKSGVENQVKQLWNMYKEVKTHGQDKSNLGS